jgi:hypothetical protein
MSQSKKPQTLLAVMLSATALIGLSACSLLEAAGGRSSAILAEMIDPLAVAVTGRPINTLTPMPTCDVLAMKAQWDAEPLPADELARFDVFVLRSEQATACALQWAQWRRANAIDESEVG